jgi:hypothetical protein
MQMAPEKCEELWAVTWEAVGKMLPDMKEELFPSPAVCILCRALSWPQHAQGASAACHVIVKQIIISEQPAIGINVTPYLLLSWDGTVRSQNNLFSFLPLFFFFGTAGEQ